MQGLNARLLFPTQCRLFMTLEKKPFENIVGKGENAGNQHFLLFPTMFSTLPNTNLDQSKLILPMTDVTEEVKFVAER